MTATTSGRPLLVDTFTSSTPNTRSMQFRPRHRHRRQCYQRVRRHAFGDVDQGFGVADGGAAGAGDGPFVGGLFAGGCHAVSGPPGEGVEPAGDVRDDGNERGPAVATGDVGHLVSQHGLLAVVAQLCNPTRQPDDGMNDSRQQRRCAFGRDQQFRTRGGTLGELSMEFPQRFTRRLGRAGATFATDSSADT